MGSGLERISKTALTDNPYYEMSKFTLPGYTTFIKYGFNPLVGTNLETVWADSGIYAYPTAAAKMKISSSSVNDVFGTGTGAWIVNIAGVDGNLDWVQETVNLNGQTEVETVNEYFRINDHRLILAGTLGTADGDLYVGTGALTSGVPANIYSKIDSADFDAVSLQTPFTVPRGYNGYVVSAIGNTGQGKEGIISIIFRPFGSVFQTLGKFSLFQQSIYIPFDLPSCFSAGTDLEMRARDVQAGTIQVGAGYVFFLERVDKTVPFILPGLYNLSETWDV